MSKVIFIYKKAPTSEYIEKYSNEYMKAHYTEEYIKSSNYKAIICNNNYKTEEDCLFWFLIDCKDAAYDTRNYSMNCDLFLFINSDYHNNYDESVFLYKKVARAFGINEFESFKIE